MSSYSSSAFATTSERPRPGRQLTICSAAYRSKTCLELNRNLTARLNPASSFTWWVVENTVEPASERLGLDDVRFQMLPAVPEARTSRTRGSYQHGASFNHALQRITGRFALFLDPDFFVVRPGWIADALDHMQAHGLSFFGAPYHPGRHTKYRYFPCVSCLLVDLERVNKSELDFTPDIDERQALTTLSAGQIAAWWATGRVPAALAAGPAPQRPPLSLIPGNIARRALMGRALWPFVGISGDVGWRIYRRFLRDPRHAADWVTPVWRDAPGTRTATRRWPARLAQWIDGLLVMPRRPGYFTRAGFRELGAWDAARHGWEEYVWRGEPFGFHVQGLSQGLKPAAAQLLGEAVDAFPPPRPAPVAAMRPAAGQPPVQAGQPQATP